MGEPSALESFPLNEQIRTLAVLLHGRCPACAFKIMSTDVAAPGTGRRDSPKLSTASSTYSVKLWTQMSTDCSPSFRDGARLL
jgi:hypothetical protein